MPRERTTWNREEVAKRASHSKQADPYTMNQDHKQPSHDKYTIGGPSDFAEDVHPSSGTWNAEYANGQVKRNEIGMPEMRSDTFNHPEKTASEVEMVKKASLAVAVARAMLPKSARSAIEEQASRLMKLADEDLVETYKALVAGEDQDQGQQDQGQDKEAAQGQAQQEEQQAKEGGQLPPWLKKDDDKEEKKDDKEEKKEAAQDQAQQEQDQGKQAQMDQQAQMQQLFAQVQQMQQMLAQLQGSPALASQQVVQAQQEEKKEDDKPDFLKDKEAAQDQGQQDQGQEQGKQAAANIQAAITAALAAGQDPAAAAMRAAQACMTQQPVADDQLIDQMLSQQDPMFADVGIEMDAPSMDTGDTMMTANDDALLAQIFASDETEQAQQAQGQKQAHVVRTASTRTVGTRPTQGVSQLGGLPSASSKESDLSSMWSSAPDVREAFGIR